MNVNETWIELIRRIPADLHDNLALGLTTGAEVVMQRVVRLDPEFMVIRGRLSGTTDTGRVLMVPYVQLTYVAIARDLKDAEVAAIFTAGAPVAAGDMPVLAAQPAAPEPAPAEAATPGEPAAAANAPAKVEQPNKKALLEKLRGQLKGK